MLSKIAVDEVKQLLAQGSMSQRQIAKRTKISRSSVALIANGRRPEYPLRGEDEDEYWHEEGPIGRCPTCGGRVHLPCRLCRVRHWQVRRQWKHPAPFETNPAVANMTPRERPNLSASAWPGIVPSRL